MPDPFLPSLIFVGGGQSKGKYCSWPGVEITVCQDKNLLLWTWFLSCQKSARIFQPQKSSQAPWAILYSPPACVLPVFTGPVQSLSCSKAAHGWQSPLLFLKSQIWHINCYPSFGASGANLSETFHIFNLLDSNLTVYKVYEEAWSSLLVYERKMTHLLVSFWSTAC